MMSFRLLFLTSLLAACVSCDNSVTVPDGALIGRWAGQGAELVLDGKTVRAEVLCGGKYQADGPIIPYQEKKFVLGVESTNPPIYRGSSVTLSGTIEGETIALEVTYISLAGSSTKFYTITRDAPTEYDLGCDQYW
jgi:hypothetical protein